MSGVATVGSTPVPVTPLVALPPLLVKMTELVKSPGPAGIKATVTIPVWPGATEYGLPAAMENGATGLAVPVKVRPPVLMTENWRLLVCPTVTMP